MRDLKRPKGEATRSQILSIALDLFREQGFAAATMRDIATRAGVATGAAYYYFDSKEAIVLAFYSQAQADLAPRMEEVLAGSKDLEARIHRMIELKFEYFAPSRRLLGALAGFTDPEHPISPFSEQTSAIREADISLLGLALDGSRTRIPLDLKDYLPRILWMYQMGLILFWIHDHSAGQEKTRALLEKSLGVIVRLIKMSNLPLTQPLRQLVRELVDIVSSTVGNK
jgi:AcrR family transcriptional regulator